ncbi:protealysin inhibitor emfourin [Acinetobacter rudis]|uniref:protealysin inhibitor emfourin n=1 Tax=Acinetobacter rudis TaxID=632955 RepID=UPI00333E535F
MAIIYVERFGGFACVGSVHSCIRSHGEINTSTLSLEELEQIENLFNQQTAASRFTTRSDQFKYRLMRQTQNGKIDKIEAKETDLPGKIISCIKDEII